MTQHSQNGEGVEVIQSDRDYAAILSPTYAASVLAGDMDDTENVQVFARYRQSLTAREPATADVGRVREAAMQKAREEGAPDEDILCFKMAYQYYDKAAALSRAAPSSGHAMGEMYPEDPRYPSEDQPPIYIPPPTVNDSPQAKPTFEEINAAFMADFPDYAPGKPQSEWMPRAHFQIVVHEDLSTTLKVEASKIDPNVALTTAIKALVAEKGDLANCPAHQSSVRCAGVPTNAQVREAMQDAWDSFCTDAQAIPGDIRREGRKTYFMAGVWADHTAMALRAILSRQRVDACRFTTAVEWVRDAMSQAGAIEVKPDFARAFRHLAKYATDEALSAFVAALSPSSRHAMAEGEREAADVFDRRPRVASPQFGSEPTLREMVRFYYGQHGQADPDGDTEQYFAALATTPPTGNVATEAHGKALFDYEMRLRGVKAVWADEDPDDQAGWIASAQVVLSTPPTPKGGLPGRGEDDDTIEEFAFLYRQYGLEADENLAPDALILKGKVLAALAPAEAIRDGREGGEAA